MWNFANSIKTRLQTSSEEQRVSRHFRWCVKPRPRPCLLNRATPPVSFFSHIMADRFNKVRSSGTIYIQIYRFYFASNVLFEG